MADTAFVAVIDLEQHGRATVSQRHQSWQRHLREIGKACRPSPCYQAKPLCDAQQIIKGIGGIALAAIVMDLFGVGRDTQKLGKQNEARKCSVSEHLRDPPPNALRISPTASIAREVQ
ncbi:hypothetical protein [Croceicoccus gelatinilyticus]|uniref:hypothetical protein n=1 Tax=Croceicoccus gelatinilyticus TaxID=2835536 RepID=UPI00235549F0|nr:hypothetical protein [Croceicoccus gelatinilyticus]